MDSSKSSLRAVPAAEKKAPRKRFSPLNLNTLEYGIIANLVVQQYQQEDIVKYDALLSIPLSDRIPGLIESYGKKTVYRLLVMMLKEFNNKLLLPKAKKLTETKVSIAACELMLLSYEDQLSLEDVILFLQRAKAGRYGAIKNLVLPSILFDKLEMYRQARHEVFIKIKEAREAAFKEMGAAPRSSSEPTQIGDLLQQAFIFDVSNRA
jgi:alpha-beta hydrolase superfamily lysophospholipase